MNVTPDIIDGTFVLHLSGEVDMSNTALIETTIGSQVSNDAHGMVLDLSDVTYLDSAGIRLLYHLDSRLGMHQQRFVVVVPAGSPILRTLQAAGVIGSLLFTASVEEGLAAAAAEDQTRTGSNGTTG